MLTATIDRFAHEVYVLTPNEVSKYEKVRDVNPWKALLEGNNLWIAIGFAVAIGASLLVAAFLKRTSFFQKVGAFFDKATVIAPDIIRIAFGASLIFSAQHNALFGPELPLTDFMYSGLLRVILLVSGIALVLGLRTRLFGIVALLIWIMSFFTKGWYMLTYTNYLAEAIAVIMLPVHTLSLDRWIYKLRGLKVPKPSFGEYGLTVTRIGFAFALFYTAITVKFIDAAVPLEVVNQYDLTRFFPFTSLFIVLGAGLVEILIAVLFAAGLLRRMTTIIFLVFVSLSIVFFKEAVWPHYLLLALGIGIFLHKPDSYALDKYWFNGKSADKIASKPKPKSRQKSKAKKK